MFAEAPERERYPFEYAIVRVVPRVERGEGINAGLIVFCRALAFLRARIELPRQLLAALAPSSDPDVIWAHLEAIARICEGEPDAGPIAGLAAPERFRWLTAPSSTVVQTSEVHAGLTEDPEASLEHLFRELVDRPRGVGTTLPHSPDT